MAHLDSAAPQQSSRAALHARAAAPSPQIEQLQQSSKAQQNLAVGRVTHQNLKKELFENTQHGTSVFPFAAYVWEPQNYTTRVSLHWHREAELVRFSQGRFQVSVDMNEAEIDGDAFLFLPGNVMHTFILPPHCEESAIVFDPKMLMLQCYDELQSEIFDALLSSNIPLPPIITPEHPAFNRIDKLYRYCVRYGTTNNASMRLIIKAKLLEILALYHEYGLLTRKDVHSSANRTKQDKLKDLLNYIDSHYAGPMTVKDASMRVGFSDQYFCRYFKHATGMSFTEYLNDLRLRRAAKEIELSSRAISDISYDHGFENAGYFFKSFKKKFGITPMQYRKNHLMRGQESGKEAPQELGPTLSPTDLDHTLARGQSVRELAQSYLDAAADQQDQNPVPAQVHATSTAAPVTAATGTSTESGTEQSNDPLLQILGNESPEATLKRYSAAYNYAQSHDLERNGAGYPQPLVKEFYEEEYEPDLDLELDERCDFDLEQGLNSERKPYPNCVSWEPFDLEDEAKAEAEAEDVAEAKADEAKSDADSDAELAAAPQDDDDADTLSKTMPDELSPQRFRNTSAPRPHSEQAKQESPQKTAAQPHQQQHPAPQRATAASKAPARGNDPLLTIQQRLEQQGVAPEVAQLADEHGIVDAREVRPKYVHPEPTRLNALEHLTGANGAWSDDWFDDIEPNLKDVSRPIEQVLDPYDGVSPDNGPIVHHKTENTERPFQASIEQLLNQRKSPKRGFSARRGKSGKKES